MIWAGNVLVALQCTALYCNIVYWRPCAVLPCTALPARLVTTWVLTTMVTMTELTSWITIKDSGPARQARQHCETLLILFKAGMISDLMAEHATVQLGLITAIIRRGFWQRLAANAVMRKVTYRCSANYNTVIVPVNSNMCACQMNECSAGHPSWAQASMHPSLSGASKCHWQLLVLLTVAATVRHRG